MGTTAPLEDTAEVIAPDAPVTAVARLLDLLRSRDYSVETCEEELRALVKSDPEAAWELVSLLDQQFRRGEIRPTAYRAVNSHLIALLLGSTYGADHPPEPPPASTLATDDVVPVPVVPAVITEEISTRVSAADEPPVGRTLRGRYRIVRAVGRGGLGTVFEAVDQFRIGAPEDQRVALKILRPAVSRRPEMLSALVREFQHLQRLSHPNIVRVHEFDRDDDVTFYTMELLSGLTLDRLLSARRRSALDRRHALAIVREIGLALAHAHSRGIVHGDINLHNVFVTDDGAVRVLDFGSSAMMRAEPWIDDSVSPECTRFATLQYASCELLEGGAAEVRDDVFAFACVAYVLLSGRHPFDERTALQARAAGTRPRRPARLPRGQWRALREGLALRRERRPTDIDQWTRRLLADTPLPALPRLPVLVAAPRREPPSRRRLVAGIAALLILAVGWLATRVPDWRWTPATAALRSPAAPPATVGRVQTPVAAVHSTGKPASASSAATVLAPIRVPRTTHAVRVHSRRWLAAAAGPARIEFATTRVVVLPGDPVARLVVDRVGNLRSVVRFRWRIEPGTARRGQDYAVAGSTEATLARGRKSTALLVPIVSDPTRSRPVSFYVTIVGAGPGTLIGPRTIASVTILPAPAP
jgi:hypothetical protein